VIAELFSVAILIHRHWEGRKRTTPPHLSYKGKLARLKSATEGGGICFCHVFSAPRYGSWQRSHQQDRSFLGCWIFEW